MIDWPLYLIALGMLVAWFVIVGAGMHLLGFLPRTKAVMGLLVLTVVACFVGAVLTL